MPPLLTFSGLLDLRRYRLYATLFALASITEAQVAVTTQHTDNKRTGQTLHNPPPPPLPRARFAELTLCQKDRRVAAAPSEARSVRAFLVMVPRHVRLQPRGLMVFS